MINGNSPYYGSVYFLCQPQDEDDDEEDIGEVLVQIPYGWEDTNNYGWR